MFAASFAVVVLGVAMHGVHGGVQPPFWPRFGGPRDVSLLDGTSWQYGLNLDSSFDSMDESFTPSSPAAATPNTTHVPSCMDATPPGYLGPRGVAMYRTKFQQQAGSPARLQLHACSFYCRVYVDGKFIGDHRAGGYVTWYVDIDAPSTSTAQNAIAQPGSSVERELFVLADNRFNKTTAPLHTGGDFWHYGGLMRSVVLHQLPSSTDEPWIWRAYVTAQDADKGLIDVEVVLTDPTYNGIVSVSLEFGNSTTQVSQAKFVNGTGVVSGVQVPDHQLWTQENPHLHVINVSAGGSGVTVSERFGLRTWGVDTNTGRLTLNGEVIKFHGWNHHTQWPDTGASPTDEQLDNDIQLLLHAGTTYVRGAHYPQDPRWLDRLDEVGIAMWEEALGPGVSVENTQDWDFFMKYQLQQMNEMIDTSMNHASIMTWGFFNEGPSNKNESCPAYAACANLAKARDPTRFQTWASDKKLTDKCLEHASLISFNSYPSWYDSRDPVEFWNEMVTGLETMKLSHVPFVISETGAGGIYEWSHNTSVVKWTTAYQTKIISADVDTALSNDKISGITLWHFFDFKGNDEAEAACGPCVYEPKVYPPICAFINITKCGGSRPGGENHKGVVDFWRRPKQAYDVVGAKYNASKAVL